MTTQFLLMTSNVKIFWGMCLSGLVRKRVTALKYIFFYGYGDVQRTVA